MLLALAVALFIIWILCIAVFHITVFFIHLLLIFAVISLILHFVRR